MRCICDHGSTAPCCLSCRKGFFLQLSLTEGTIWSQEVKESQESDCRGQVFGCACNRDIENSDAGLASGRGVTAQCRSSPSFQPDKLQNLNSFAYLLKKQHGNQLNWRYMIEVIKSNKLTSNCTMRFGQSRLALGFKILDLLGPTQPASRLGEVLQVLCFCQRHKLKVAHPFQQI